MSTDMQGCSLENQAVAIQRYADANGFVVVKTYEDAGRSGLTITQRKGLQSLLADVVQHRATFHAVLVYDVSRWGRFQDSDEAAHYEFLCKSSGVKVHYCAEEFGPDETLPARMMKALKRTMAAEFSRELSERISAAKKNRALMGFHEGGQPGYALRRVLVGSDGTVKQVLRSGELKSISSDHIVLVPGPEREQKWVRWIYEQRISGLQICDIVKELNLRKVPWIEGKPWNIYSVRQVLTNRKYAGWNCWAQRTEKLKTKCRRNPPDQWVMVEGAFKRVVDQATFDRAQRVIRRRLNYKSNEAILNDLKALWKRRGTLSEAIIDCARGVPAVSSLRHRFGSMAKLYALLGFKPAPIHAINTAKAQTMLRLRAQVFASIRESFPYDVAFTHPSGRHGYRFTFADTGDVAVVLCRSYDRPEGLRCWMMYLRAVNRDVPALVCLLSRDNQSIEAYYVMPKIDAITKMTLTPKDPWFRGGIRLESMSELHSALTEVKKWVPLGMVHRGVSNAYTLLMGPPSRTRIHDEERREARIARQIRLAQRPRVAT
jgi:DNA invertase Pin-like site-specific DNA recombinase